MVDIPPHLRRRIAEAYAGATTPNRPPQSVDLNKNNRRVHVGYLSHDFNNHPTAHLMEGLFVHHDTLSFEISTWSYGKGNVAYRKSIPTLSEHFMDVVLLGTNEAAAAIEAARVPHSELWLLHPTSSNTHDLIVANLVREAAQHGVAAARLRFLPRRVGVSLLANAHLPWLIVHSCKEFEDVAGRKVETNKENSTSWYTLCRDTMHGVCVVRLATSPQILQRMVDTLDMFGPSAATTDAAPLPLFQTHAYTINLERIHVGDLLHFQATMSSAAEVFETMDVAVREAGAALVSQVKGTIKFDVTGAGQWLIQVKASPSGVSKASADDKADVTITISEPNFLLLIAEKLNPQTAFMQGKIKIKGNMGLASKLTAVIAAYKKKIASAPSTPAAAPATPPSAAKPTLRSAAIFAAIGEAITAKGPELVSKVKGTIQFVITPGGAWYVDLKNGAGSIEAATKPANLTITASDDDFMAIADGKLNAQQGKLKVKGNMGLAMKLPVVIEAAKAPRSKL
ncbi:hypothetical protein DYB34_006192 [Aphanomyces astaci]|uniref:SCP2 domain-containing protein n=1 Tax=Aphanomyces astaci TaxID=112090 RepID=A0A3R7DLF2_APHAT|nr:hypothetical protein DYB34_006192 [Aphanomyces astaci]